MTEINFMPEFAGGAGDIDASSITSGTIDAARLPSGYARSIAVFGDSITSQIFDKNTAGASNYCYFADNGYLTHAQAIAGVDFDFKVDAGIGGNKTNEMLARIQTDVIAYSPDVCVVMGGVNDMNSRAVTDIYNDLVSICNTLRAEGIIVILASPPPVTTGTSAQYKGLSALRHKLESFCNSSKGILFWDAYACCVDATTATSNYKTNYSGDGVHPNNLGAYSMGASLAPILSNLFQKRNLVCSQNDTKTTNADSNQLLANPVLAGSVAVSGTGVSGTKPTSWNSLTPTNQAGGAATVYTAGGSANGGVGYKCTIACTGAAAAASIHYLYSEDVSALFADNNTYQAAARIKIAASSGLKNVRIKIGRNAGAGKATSCQWNYPSSKTQDIASGTEYLACITPAMHFVAGGSVNLWIEAELSAGGSATIDIEQVELRDLGALTIVDNELGS